MEYDPRNFTALPRRDQNAVMRMAMIHWDNIRLGVFNPNSAWHMDIIAGEARQYRRLRGWFDYGRLTGPADEMVTRQYTEALTVVYQDWDMQFEFANL